MAIDIIARGMVEDSNGYISQLFDITKGGEAVSGESSYTISNAVDYPLLGLSLYGKSTQDGTPTPDAPMDIVSVGDNGFDIITKDDTHFNLLSVRDNGKGIITKQPVSAVGKNGETKQFIVSASGSVLTYQWWQNVNDGKGWVIIDTVGARTSTYTIPVAAFRDGYKYRCVITDNNGNSETSNEATLYVVSADCEIKTASIATDALPWCGIPVSEGGNYTDSNGQQWICDELVYNADGTGKIIKHTAKYTFTGNENFTFRNNDNGRCVYALVNFLQYKYYSGTHAVVDKYLCIDTVNSATAAISNLKIGEICFYYDKNFPNPPNTAIYFGSSCTTLADFKSEIAGLVMIYPLATPQEIELTASEISALKLLQTFDGVTNFSNSADADMSVKYCTNKALSEYVLPVMDSKADSSHTHDVATTSANGLMSAVDKTKLDNVTSNATKVEKSTTNGNIKINGTETTVYTHPSGTNPHGTTKSDVGLGNVPNVATNDQTPTFTEASSLTKLTSGEKLSVAFGKISKAITDLITHIGDNVKHITSTERTNWNSAKTHADSAHAPSNAQANQNAFSNIVVGSTTVAADTATDTLTLVGSNVTLTPDATNDKVTIGITKANVTSALGYTPPTTDTWRDVVDNLTSTDATKSLSANQGRVLKGLIDSNSYNTMTGASDSADGTSGLVPAPVAGDQDKFLRADGTWLSPPSIGSSVSCIVNGTGSSFTYEGDYKLFFYNVIGVSVNGSSNIAVTYESRNGWAILRDTDTAVYRKLAYYSYQSGASSITTVTYYLEISHGKVRIVDNGSQLAFKNELSGVTLEIYAV